VLEKKGGGCGCWSPNTLDFGKGRAVYRKKKKEFPREKWGPDTVLFRIRPQGCPGAWGSLEKCPRIERLSHQGGEVGWEAKLFLGKAFSPRARTRHSALREKRGKRGGGRQDGTRGHLSLTYISLILKGDGSGANRRKKRNLCIGGGGGFPSRWALD